MIGERLLARVTYISSGGEETTVDAAHGDSLMQTAIANGVDGIVGECGGSMMCATCHVYVEEAFLDRLPERSEGEVEMLDCAASEQRGNSRLSCQIKAGPEIDGIVVRLPGTQQ